MSYAGFAVVRQHPRLLEFIDMLQRKNAEALAFYPTSALEREASKGRTNATLWRKHKQTGVVNQFVRGKKMLEYRSLLLEEESPECPST